MIGYGKWVSGGVRLKWPYEEHLAVINKYPDCAEISRLLDILSKQNEYTKSISADLIEAQQEVKRLKAENRFLTASINEVDSQN